MKKVVHTQLAESKKGLLTASLVTASLSTLVRPIRKRNLREKSAGLVNPTGCRRRQNGSRLKRTVDAKHTTFRSEPVVSHLTVGAKEGLKFYRRPRDIQIETKIAASYANGRYGIDLGSGLDSYWLFMK
jgi:hypothetical protein